MGIGYVNLSIYIGKTSKKVSGKKKSMARLRAVKVEKAKNSPTSKSGIFTSRFKFGTKMKSLPQNGLEKHRISWTRAHIG